MGQKWRGTLYKGFPPAPPPPAPEPLGKGFCKKYHYKDGGMEE